MPEQVPRVFHPLSGDEVKEVILRDIRRALDGDPRLEPHLTFPLIDWQWTLEMKLHYSEDSIQHRAGGRLGTEDALQSLESGEHEVVLLQGARKSDTPDEVRTEAELPINVPTQTSAGTFDLMEEAHKKV